MNKSSFQPIKRSDYRPPEFLVDSIDLDFFLDETQTLVKARSQMRRNPASDQQSGPLTLAGEKLELIDLVVDGSNVTPERFTHTAHELVIEAVPHSFIIEVTTRINPKENTALTGLYLAGANYCSQCEAEGFRRITYYPDRPDVLARFSTRITAPRTTCPILLSNGNLIDRGDLEGDYHFAYWQDPFPKPSYLFALVAGDLICKSDSFITESGREITLQIYVEKKNEDKCEHAMRSLQKAMKWDEEVFGLEYDLDRYMIVAVDDFNMGAMENKGLNVFNSKYVLASPDSATDEDYLAIEAVIGHEYFHNWTGNRVTCRDWFQLSLKEGLTVFRDQEFSADTNSRAVQRIKDVRLLRQFQFREDAGPMAHPVRPESYVEINNFYTATVYNKGAEVVRMLHTLLGATQFRRGMDLYIKRHDGCAVTCNDFLAAMADASGRDLDQFELWYAQAGTPHLTISERMDEHKGEYCLTISQHTEPTPGQPEKKPFHIPILIGLLDEEGNDLAASVDTIYPRRGNDFLLELQKKSQSFVFYGLKKKVFASVLRNFSAPVKIKAFQGMDACAFLMSHDTDPFNRWDAAFSMSETVIIDLAEQRAKGGAPVIDRFYVEAMRRNLVSDCKDRSLLAFALQLPTENYLAQAMKIVDPTAIHHARQFVKQELARLLYDDLIEVYETCVPSVPYQLTPEQIGNRALSNVCLDYLTSIADDHAELVELCQLHYFNATNMTDRVGALSAMVHLIIVERKNMLAHFEERWSGDSLVMDKWFAIQATSDAADTHERVLELMNHHAFSIKAPNKVRSLIGAFSHNHYHFHEARGRGYRFLSAQIMKLDPINPQIAARLLTPLTSWKRYDVKRQELMKAELETIAAVPTISRDVFEVVKKSLEQ